MKISHLNIAVPDVAATRSFFEKFFDLRCTESKGDNVLSVLTDEDGLFFLTLSNFKKNVIPVYPEDFHIGFIRMSIAQVNDLYERLKAAGVEASAPKNAHGRWGFYVSAPGGVPVEVASYGQAV